MEVDRLVLNDDASSRSHEELGGLAVAEEELLRLDDGTLLPAELTELRSLLQLHAAARTENDEAQAALSGLTDDPEHAAQLAQLAAAKAEMLRDCLLAFDEGMLLLHDKLLDHEALCKRLAAVRRRKASQPTGRLDFDEAVTFDDGDDGGDGEGGGGGGGGDAGGSDDDDDALDLSDLLKLDAPGGAGPRRPQSTRPVGSASGIASTTPLDGSAALPPTADATAGAATAAATTAAATTVPEEEGGEDEEALDQKVAASRQQLKTWVRALEQGKLPGRQAPPQPSVHSSAGDVMRPQPLHSGAPRPADDLLASRLEVPPSAGPGELPPVKPPVRARLGGSYSMRLRNDAAAWRAREFR